MGGAQSSDRLDGAPFPGATRAFPKTCGTIFGRLEVHRGSKTAGSGLADRRAQRASFSGADRMFSSPCGAIFGRPVHRPEGQVAERERVVEVARVATKPEPIDDIEQKGYGFRVAIRVAARGQTQRPLEANRLYADSWVKVHCDSVSTDGDADERTMAVSASGLFDGRPGRCGAQRSQQSGAPTPDRYPGQASRDSGEPVRRLRKPRRLRNERRSCRLELPAVSSAQPKDRSSNAGRCWQGAAKSLNLDPFPCHRRFRDLLLVGKD